jgi:hypothetical protein
MHYLGIARQRHLGKSPGKNGDPLANFIDLRSDCHLRFTSQTLFHSCNFSQPRLREFLDRLKKLRSHRCSILSSAKLAEDVACIAVRVSII